jgi:hypothetical protein
MNIYVYMIIFLSAILQVNAVCLTEQIDTSINHVRNGDFETPFLGVGNWRFTTDQLDGWTSTKI